MLSRRRFLLGVSISALSSDPARAGLHFHGNPQPTPGYFNFTGLNLPIYTAAVAATKAGSSNTKLLVNGDSTVAGYGSNGTTNFVAASAPSAIAGLINSGIVTANSSFWTSHSGTGVGLNADGRMVFTGSWTATATRTIGGGLAQSGAVNDFFTFTPANPVDTFEIELASNTAPQTGTMAFSVDGGATLVTTVTGSTNSIIKAVVTTTLGIHALKGLVTVQNANGVFPMSVYAYNSAAKEVSVCNAGIPGAVALNYLEATFAFSVAPSITFFAPNLVLAGFGINDWDAGTVLATFQSQIATFIANVQAAGSDIILYSENTTNGTANIATQATYVAAIKAAALAAGVPFIDVWGTNFGGAFQAGLMFDTLHPNATGYAQIANFIYPALVPGFISH